MKYISKQHFIYLGLSLSLSLLFLFLIVPSATAHAGVPLGEQLAPPGATAQSGHSYTLLYKGWQLVLGMANILAALILLGLAAINILHLNYDTYQIKKTLPNLIIGIIMANFSFLICRMFISSADILTFTFTQGDQNGLLWRISQELGFWQLGAGLGILSIFTGVLASVGIFLLILGLLMLLAPFIVLFLLWLILWFRVAALYLLIVIAPGAFVCLGFAPTYGFFKEWWCQFIRYTYMYPAVFFVLWLAFQISNGAWQGNAAAGTHDISLALWAVTIAMVYAAITLPFSFMPCKYANFMSGYGKVLGKFGKWAGKQAWNGINGLMERNGGWSPRAQMGAWNRNRGGNLDSAIANIRRGTTGPSRPPLVFPGGGQGNGPRGGGGGANNTNTGPVILGGGAGGPSISLDSVRGTFTPSFVRDNPQEALTQFDSALAGFAENEESREQILARASSSGVNLNSDDFDNLQDNDVRSRVMRAVFTDSPEDQQGLTIVSALQEEAASQGNFTAQDVFNTDAGYFAYDRSNPEHQNVLNDRWSDSLSSNLAKGKLESGAVSSPAVLQQLVENNVLNADHINEISQHETVIRQLSSDSSLRVLHDVASQADSPASTNARNILVRLEQTGHISRGSSAPANVVEVNFGDGSQQMPISQIDSRLNTVTDPSIRADIQGQIQQAINSRFNHFSAQVLRQLQTDIQASGAFDRNFKDNFVTKVDWQEMRENFQQINRSTYEQAQASAQAQINNLVGKLNTDLGTALRAQVNVPEQIGTIIRSIPAIKQQANDATTLRQQVQDQIHNAIKNSTAQILTDANNQPITAQRIIQAYEHERGQSSDNSQVQVRLIGDVTQQAGHPLTPDQQQMIATLIRAYAG